MSLTILYSNLMCALNEGRRKTGQEYSVQARYLPTYVVWMELYLAFLYLETRDTEQRMFVRTCVTPNILDNDQTHRESTFQ